MNLFEKLKVKLAGKEKPGHLRRGELGERAAKKFLQKAGLKFLAANFRSERGEIDLIFHDGDCLAFVEVKTRSSEEWSRPAAAVNAERQRRLSQMVSEFVAHAGGAGFTLQEVMDRLAELQSEQQNRRK